jgi:hypothetical protein
VTGYQRTHPWPADAITDDAACRGSLAVMYGVERGSRRDGLDWEPARQICARCPVRDACLAHALDNDERDGMWGGLDPEERRRRREGISHVPNWRPCAECGDLFDAPTSRKGGGLFVTCSDACRVDRKNRQERERFARLRPPPHEKTCAECGDEFTTTRSQVVTCSAECYRERDRKRDRNGARARRVSAAS